MFQFVLTTKIEYYVNRLIACDFNLNEQRKIKDYRYRLIACDSFRSTNKIKRKCRIIKIDLALAILSVSRRKKVFNIIQRPARHIHQREYRYLHIHHAPCMITFKRASGFSFFVNGFASCVSLGTQTIDNRS